MSQIPLLPVLLILTGCSCLISSQQGDNEHEVGYQFNSERTWQSLSRVTREIKSFQGSEHNIAKDDDKRDIMKQGKGLMSGVLGMGVGTLFSGMNAAGQTINNVAGSDSIVGKFGNMVTEVAENYAGKIKFILFTKKNPVVGFELTPATAANSPFDKNNDVIAVIHGFTPAGYFANDYDNMISSFRVKDGLMDAKLLHNVILVDWTGLSSDGAYVFSSTSTATTADRLSSLLVWLVQNGYVKSGKNIRIIGHSLGGHTAGITGKKFFEKYKLGKVARIDAIDPAGPNFDQSPSEFQLTQFNGDYVHVMHCNIGLLGSKLNRGTVDFYPNGGDNLPGCESGGGTGRRKKRSISGSAEKHICNHLRCIDLYIETLLDEKLGCKCPSWKKYLDNKCDCQTSPDKPRMGYHCPETAKGVYYLNVTMQSKFEQLPENHTNYNNYGAGGPIKEEAGVGAKIANPLMATVKGDSISQLLSSISAITNGTEPASIDPADEPQSATTPANTTPPPP